ncbi:37S ribosomal protein Mrp10 [Xylariaceae sp. FL0255]|nr:37S ribosomal protein Mrp10 [Xylariaceae sp. FL0255]
MSAAQRPIRLPPLKALHVKNPNGRAERPCMGVMSSVLSCWASAGYSTAGCIQVEEALRQCMDGPKLPPPRRSEINYHLSRFKDKLTYPASKKK